MQPAFEGDVLRVMTWPVEMSGARAIRAYEISRETKSPPGLMADRLIEPDLLVPVERARLVVRARTEWAFVDVERGRPRRIPREVWKDFLDR